MTECRACDDDREVYYESEEGAVLGPCILCDHEAFMAWIDEAEIAGYSTDVVRDDADLVIRESRPDATLGLPF